jgi:hypothetical protein
MWAGGGTTRPWGSRTRWCALVFVRLCCLCCVRVCWGLGRERAQLRVTSVPLYICVRNGILACEIIYSRTFAGGRACQHHLFRDARWAQRACT